MMTGASKLCSKCNIPVDLQVSVCPKCGGDDFALGLPDKGRGLDGFDLEARGAGGELHREMTGRTDGKKEGVIAIDHTGDEVAVRRSGTRSAPLDKLSEENSSAATFADALNRRDGSAFWHQPKEKEDSKVPDIWIIDEGRPANDRERRRGVQVTHLDTDAIASLGSREAYDLLGDVGSIAQAAVAAIGNKQRVDHADARKTFLLLICPYPIRESIQGEIRDRIQAAAPSNVYRETWIASLGETPFRVQ